MREKPPWCDRRSFLALGGASALAVLAGCPGPLGGTATDRPTAVPPSDPVVAHTGVTTADPDRVQFNPANDEARPAIAHHLLFDPFGQYYYADPGYRPAGIEDWTVEPGERVTLTLRSGLTWSDGSSVTARDVRTQLELARTGEGPLSEWAGAIRAPDDRTIVVEMAEPVTPSIAENDLLGRRIQQSHAEYGDFLDRDRAALEAFANRDPLTSGPFTVASRSVSRLVTEQREAHPDAEVIDVDQYVLERPTESQMASQLLADGSVDSHHQLTVPAEIVADFPDVVEEVQTPAVFGLGLAPNHTDRRAGDRAIRRAIQYVANRRAAADRSLPRVKRVPTVPTGIASDYQRDWLGETMADFEQYGPATSATNAATAVLEAAGYAMQGGTWEDADGSTVAVEITHPPGWSDWTLALESVVSDLTAFGFEATLVSASEPYFDVIANRDRFQFVANTWLHGGPTVFPYYDLTHQLREPQHHACHTAYPGYTSEYGGSAATIEVDEPTPNDGETAIDVAERLDELASTATESRIRDLVQDLAWVANRDLARIPLLETYDQQWLRSDDWRLPDVLDEHPDAEVHWAPTWLTRRGELRARGWHGV